jgi:hypothetical protein
MATKKRPSASDAPAGTDRRPEDGYMTPEDEPTEEHGAGYMRPEKEPPETEGPGRMRPEK